jgi:hypothetical protein
VRLNAVLPGQRRMHPARKLPSLDHLPAYENNRHRVSIH